MSYPGHQRRIMPMGNRALLLQCGSPGEALAVYRDLDSRPLNGASEAVPGETTLLVRFDRWVVEADYQHLSDRYRTVVANDAHRTDREIADITIDVVYDGPDLAAVAAHGGVAIDTLIAAHTGTRWQVAFCGFAPGFGYLVRDHAGCVDAPDPLYDVPRHASPRTTVPAGSVAMAGRYSGVYPRSLPGGWQIIGRTDAPLWESARRPPALLQPGMGVRFRAVREIVAAGEPRGASAQSAAAAATGSPVNAATPAVERGWAVEVVEPGMQCLIEDLGRHGFSAMGVSASGAADRGAAASANALVGNDSRCAVIEILFGGAQLRFSADTTIAVTGAPVPVSITPSYDDPPGQREEQLTDRPPQPDAGAYLMESAMDVLAGSTVHLGRPRTGLRTYLAVRGGIDAPKTLGSRSTDVLSGLGPAPLRRGDRLAIKDAAPGEHDRIGDARRQEPGHAALTVQHAQAHDDACDDAERQALLMVPGPHHERFDLPAVLAGSWRVDPRSNRTAVRLTRPDVPRRCAAQITSQPLVRGAIQLPPSGELVVFLADHPVTGGYPVVGVLTDEAADRAAQLRPGETIRLDVVSQWGTS